MPRSPPLSYGDGWITENPLGPSYIYCGHREWLTTKNEHTPVQAPCSHLFAIETIVTSFCSLFFVLRHTKNTELKHDDAVADSGLNIWRKACWFRTQNECATLAPHSNPLAVAFLPRLFFDVPVNFYFYISTSILHMFLLVSVDVYHYHYTFSHAHI